MAIYQARRRLIDTMNGFVIPFGSYVDTDEAAWVARFGGDLKKVSESIPHGVKPLKVSGTVESKKAGEVSGQEETEPTTITTPEPRTRAVRRRATKVVEQSQDKAEE